MQEKMNQMLRLAQLHHATDIHFVMKKEKLSVSMRGLYGMEEIYSPALDASLFHYLKYLSNLDLGNLSVPQSGNFQYTYEGNLLYFRFSLLTTLHMQTAVLRILNNHSEIELKDLTKDQAQLQSFMNWTKIRSGLIVLSGPTGSGKTTTLHAILHQIANDHHLQVVSLEDPIEIFDDSYLQLQINEKNNFSYEEGIKQLMRHDPDVIMIGEIRDPSSARMLLRSALSGHLIFTTIHAKSCSEAIKRLNEFGLSNEELTHTLSAIVNQRLYPSANGKGRVCIYEIMEKEELQYCLAHGQSKKTYRDISANICAAVSKGWIKEKDASYDLVTE
ncbi:ATPase, T2SS/T4P/T4SS family [Absiella sp. AM29-15]|uniref:ATPase, T2SS/T4P/T4SS family n=1 Tax=Absiella sp. AM29-15 TaxID=2292278 RepID=UPI000E428D78|nr:ATPase, T2SS/T4P/T4SS family [Absiella sp. AM29-15]RGC52624.1 competence protein ComG [Absiella sp. AM29-15]